MTTLLLAHPLCRAHQTPEGHPERPERLAAVEERLAAEEFADLVREEVPAAERAHILRAHDRALLHEVEGRTPLEGLEPLDADTWLSPGGFEAALRAAGAGVRAVDALADLEADNAFCAVRPPGHHAERHRAMGFCLFNNIAIAARHAQEAYGVERLAIVDFDAHHGNGTQNIFWDDAGVLYCSTHQSPAYPGSGDAAETGAHGNIVNCPLPPGSGSHAFREAMRGRVLPALDAFEPEFLFISAGFDAHERDPLVSLELTEEDFTWATLRLMDLAARHCEGRIVSMLEGGYDLEALAASAAAHVRALMKGA